MKVAVVDWLPVAARQELPYVQRLMSALHVHMDMDI